MLVLNVFSHEDDQACGVEVQDEPIPEIGDVVHRADGTRWLVHDVPEASSLYEGGVIVGAIVGLVLRGDVAVNAGDQLVVVPPVAAA